VNLHSYDGIERRYRHTDAAQEKGRSVAAQILNLPEPITSDLLFDLSLYSGGTGVLDRLAISLPADPALWSQITESLQLRTLEDAAADEGRLENLLWLFTGKEDAIPLGLAAVQFINQERRHFQPSCTSSSRILIGDQSDVNDWVVVWGDEQWLNYLAFSQG
jgi:hypothetical protein